MSIIRYAGILLLSAVTLAACAESNPSRNDAEGKHEFVDAVRSRAAFDLSCPAEQLAVQNIGAESFGISGCNKRASYTCICMYHVWDTCTKPACQMNHQEQSAQAPTD